MKGQLPTEEIQALPKEFRVSAIHRLEVPGLKAERHLIVIEKGE
jgi:16S rRNA (guanine527-N7)-methyltransferase